MSYITTLALLVENLVFTPNMVKLLFVYPIVGTYIYMRCIDYSGNFTQTCKESKTNSNILVSQDDLVGEEVEFNLSEAINLHNLLLYHQSFSKADFL